MIEYPHIPSSAKAPREACIAFDKLDGSSIRIKYTQKRGFDLFGSRTQLIDAAHPFLGGVVANFKVNFEQSLLKIIKKEWPGERELIVFGEYLGEKSFAGMHEPTDETRKFVMFDVLFGHKNRKFVLPQDFIKLFQGTVEIPRVIYEGDLNDELIKDVQEGKHDVTEGVICKGTQRTGDVRGSVWMAKIKTQAYLDRLFNKFGDDGLKKYGE